MPKPTIKDLEMRLASAIARADSYHSRNLHVEHELANAKARIEDLVRDKNWIKQLCQEQSSSIAGYMRSR